VRLEKGRRYQVSIKRREAWFDDKIPADTLGMRSANVPWLMYAGMPFRRYPSQPWFSMIARVGARGWDEYPLDLVACEKPRKGRRPYIAEFEARRNGELFLFVNDAVVALPRIGDIFYRNNEGTAYVVITEVRPGGCPPSRQATAATDRVGSCAF